VFAANWRRALSISPRRPTAGECVHGKPKMMTPRTPPVVASITRRSAWTLPRSPASNPRHA